MQNPSGGVRCEEWSLERRESLEMVWAGAGRGSIPASHQPQHLPGGESCFTGWETWAGFWEEKDQPHFQLTSTEGWKPTQWRWSAFHVLSPLHLTTGAKPSSPFPCCAARAVSILSGFGGLSEMHQKKHSLWKVVWNSHKKRFIVFLSSSWAGVAVWTFFFSLSPFWRLTVWLLAGAWEPRGW